MFPRPTGLMLTLSHFKNEVLLVVVTLMVLNFIFVPIAMSIVIKWPFFSLELSGSRINLDPYTTNGAGVLYNFYSQTGLLTKFDLWCYIK